MRASLLERCTKQIQNETLLRKGHFLEFESMVKLGAMMYVDAGREVDVAELKECKKILKQKVGIFSNLRGYMQYLVQIKMALSGDPSGYVDGVLGVYEQLKSGLILPGERVSLAATVIYENCPGYATSEVARRTREAYEMVKQQHRFLTGEEDLATLALIVMSGKNPAEAAAQAEELYASMKGDFIIGSDTPQTAAMILALSDKPADQKVDDFFALYEACKAAGHATSRDKSMAIYAAFADLEAERNEIVAEIGEVDEWLKGNKGYGALGIGGSMRRLFAATIVLEDRQANTLAAKTGTTSAVAQAIVQDLLMILISIIVTTIVVSSVASSSSH